MEPVTVAVDAALAALGVRRPSLLGVAGSRAYGLARPDSDVDLRGFYQAPLDEVLALRQPPASVQPAEGDVVVYELAKYLSMLLESNPNVVEQLWLDSYPVCDEAGAAVRAMRESFLSKRAVRKFGGFATNQLTRFERLAADGTAKGRLAERTKAKHILHCFRVLEQGRRLFVDGVVHVTVDDPERLWAMTRLPADELVVRFTQAMADMDVAAEASALPEEPDYAAANRLLVELRLGGPRTADVAA